MLVAVKTPNLRTIVWGVIAVHCVILGYVLSPSATEKRGELPKQRVVVRSVALASAPSHETSQPSPAKAEKKKVVTKAETPRPVSSKKTAQVVSARSAAIAKAKASLAEAHVQSSATDGSSLTASPALPALPLLSDAVADPSVLPQQVNMTYEEELAFRLKAFLRLPEYGNVKVDITLDRTGHVQHVHIVEAENEANRRYAEATLPKCKFPDFGKHFDQDLQRTFTLVLSNDL